MSDQSAAKVKLLLASRLGEPRPAGRGEVVFECPRCVVGGKDPKLGVNLAKGVFNCYRCGYSGRLAKLARDIGLEVDGLILSAPQDEQQVVTAMEARRRKANAQMARSMLTFLGPQSATSSNVCESQAWHYIVNTRGVDPITARRARVAISSDPYWMGYVLFPVFADLQCQELVYLTGRTYMNLLPKQRNAPTGLLPASRSGCVFGAQRARMLGWAAITEAPLDACHVGPFACATYGMGVTEDQIGVLTGLGLRRVVWYYDREVEAQRVAWEAASKVSGSFPHGAWVAVPPRKDPAESTEVENAAALARAVRVTPETRAMAAAALAAGTLPWA